MPANPLGGTGGHSSESLRRRGAAGSIPAGRVTPPQRIEYRLAQRRRRVAADREADRPVTAVQPLVETASITASIHRAWRERNAIPVREEKGGTGPRPRATGCGTCGVAPIGRRRNRCRTSRCAVPRKSRRSGSGMRPQARWDGWRTSSAALRATPDARLRISRSHIHRARRAPGLLTAPQGRPFGRGPRDLSNHRKHLEGFGA